MESAIESVEASTVLGAPEGCDVTKTFDSVTYGCTARVAVSMQDCICARCSDSFASSSSSERLFAFGLTDFSVLVRKGEELHSVSTLKGHTKMITDVQFSKNDPNLLYSSSLDGAIRLWDFRQNKTVREFRDDATGSVKPLTCFGLNCNETFLCAGTETIVSDSYLLFWDLRSTKLLGGYWESHTDDVTQTCFHGTDPNRLATSATDGLINLFDISETEEDDALQQTLNTEVSVDVLRWYDDGKKLACLTYNETVQFWDVEESDLLISNDREAVAAELKVEEAPVRFITMCTNDKMGNLCLLASTKRENVLLIRIEDDKFIGHGLLQGAHKAELTLAYWDLQNEWAITADESSLLCHWKKGADDVNLSLNTMELSASKMTKKKDVRQKPY